MPSTSSSDPTISDLINDRIDLALPGERAIPTMTDKLSPAAQAVLDAANGASSWGPDDCLNDACDIAAAALCAAADQVVPLFIRGSNATQVHTRIEIRRKLLSIAAELAHPAPPAEGEAGEGGVCAALAQPGAEVGQAMQLPEQAPDEHPPSNLDRREIVAWYHGHGCGWQAARAVLARWGRPAPPAEGEVGK